MYFERVNNIQALFQSYKAGIVEKKDFDYYYKAWGEDTTYCTPSYVKTFLVIVTGTSKTGQRYYLFDSDNDFDLSDETPFETSLVSKDYLGDKNKKFTSHKIIYEKNINGKIQQDSTWIAFFENDYMWLHFCEKASATFQFDTIKYTIDVQPSISYRYRGGTKFIVSNGYNKSSNNFKVGEYLKLGNSFYQLSCSNDGLKIYLTKDNNASNHGSTQIGMPPIQFAARTLKGDTINFPSDFKGKYVLLDFWSLGCAPCIQEIKDYYIYIYEMYGGSKFEIIGVADDKSEDLEKVIKKNGIKWTIIPDKEQKLIQKKYNISHYPTLYFINPEGEIIADERELRGGKFATILGENIKVEN